MCSSKVNNYLERHGLKIWWTMSLNQELQCLVKVVMIKGEALVSKLLLGRGMEWKECNEGDEDIVIDFPESLPGVATRGTG